MASPSSATPPTDTGDTVSAELSELSYEQARDELINVVNQLEQGGASLEESLVLWERGEALADRCEEWLIGAKARLDAARLGAVQGAQGEDSPTAEAKHE